MYYVLEITTVNGATAKAVTEKATIDEAKMLFHQIMASAYASNKVSYALCMIINDKGFCEVMERIPTATDEE